MLALFTLTIALQVEDEEEAHAKAINYEKTARLGMVAALEQSEEYVESGWTLDDVEKFGRLLGVGVTIIPDEMRLEKVEPT